MLLFSFFCFFCPKLRKQTVFGNLFFFYTFEIIDSTLIEIRYESRYFGKRLGRICQIILFFLICQILVPLCFSFSFSLSYSSVNSVHYSIKILVVLPSLCTHHTPTPTLFRQEKKKSILKAVSFFFLPPLNITLISYHIALRFFSLIYTHTLPLASSPILSPPKGKGKKK